MSDNQQGQSQGNKSSSGGQPGQASQSQSGRSGQPGAGEDLFFDADGTDRPERDESVVQQGGNGSANRSGGDQRR